MKVKQYRCVLSKEMLGLNGLELFAHNVSSKASHPLEMHTHENCIEMVFILKGNECYFTENQYFNVSGGDIFVSYFNQPHSNGGTNQGISEFIWFQLNLSTQDNFLGLSKESGNLLRSKLLELDTHILKSDKECLHLIKESFKAFSIQTPESKMYAQGLFISFLSKLIFMRMQLNNNNFTIDKIKKYIDENIFEVITLDELCLVGNISLSSLKHKFKDYAGTTPRDYINYRKIEKAKELLIKGESVTKTAMALSFNTSEYFSAVFKKYTTYTPHEFLKS